MTPLELLEDVKARFPLLLIQDDGQMRRLLRLSLQAYQDQAGLIVERHLKADEIDKSDPVRPAPGNALAPIHAEDARGSVIFIREVEREDGPAWSFDLTPCHVAPYVLRYFYDFVGMDYERHALPRGTTGLIGEHLYAQLDIVNTVRTRQVNQASEIPYDHLRSDGELYQAKADAELAMQENAAIVPPVMAA